MELATAIAQIVYEIFHMVNHERASEWKNKFTRLQLELQKEEAKGDLSDDAKIEQLRAEFKIIAEAAKNEILTAFLTKS